MAFSSVSSYGTVSRILLRSISGRKSRMRYPACVEQVPPDAESGRPGGLIGAVDNVLRLLRLFEDHEMIRVNQVAREMGLSRSTVHRMLVTLSHHQFVEQDEYSRAYIHYLFKAKEQTAMRLLTIHNLAYLQRLMAELRAAIDAGRLPAAAAAVRAGAAPLEM